MKLEQLDTHMWTLPVPHSMLGLQLGARMTLVRLADESLWVHSPVDVDANLMDEIRSLGRVRHIVAPNLFHHLYVGPMARAFPEARVYAPNGLRRKRRDLPVDVDLGGETSQWGDAFEAVPMFGTLLGEVVFFHEPTRTIITADLIENFGQRCEHWLTRSYLRVNGLADRPGFSTMLRPTVRQRERTKRDIDQILAWDVERVVLSHQDILRTDIKDTIRHAYRFL